MDLNLTGINTEELLNPPPDPDTPKLDLSGIDTSVFSNPASSTILKKKSYYNRFEPTNSSWDISKASNIQKYYRDTFGSDMPITNFGQGKIHNQAGYNYDHRGSLDVPFNVGEKLEPYLRENNIPFTKFTSAKKGVATGPHYHIGLPSKKTNETFPVGTTLSQQQNKPEQRLNLEGIDIKNLFEETQQAEPTLITKKTKEQTLNLEGVDTSSLEEAISKASPIDPLKINDFKAADNSRYSPLAIAAAGWTQANKPLIVGKNPTEAGNPIIVESKGHTIDLNLFTDKWLNAWKPEYKELNDQYRKETGGANIMDVGNPGSIVAFGNPDEYNYKIQARPTREVQALFEAYKTGGLPALIATDRLANKQREDYLAEYSKQYEELRNKQEEHPYIKNLMTLVPALQILRNGQDIKNSTIWQRAAVSDFQLLQNIKNLGQALYIGNTQGYDSSNYLELINQDRRDQGLFDYSDASIPRAQTFGRQVFEGTLGGVIATPKFIAVGALGGSYSLPVLVYLENLHRGNIEAARAALPMAIMAGVGHGWGEFLNKGTPASRDVIQFDEEGNQLNIKRQFSEIDQGAGNIAPFKRITGKDLSLFQDTLTKGESVSIGQLTPFQRQLVLRGSNALTLAGTGLLFNLQQNLTETAANLIIGLSFPVGESPKEVKFPTLETGEKQITNNATASRLGLVPAKVNVPLEPAKISGGQERGISTTYLPSGEAPANTYKERPYSALSNAPLEKGFEATSTGADVKLPLDVAAFNYLDLERSIKEGTYKNKGDSLVEDLKKQQSIQVAMETLKKGLPEPVLEFYRQNETLIRSAIKGNYDLQEQKLGLQKKNIGIEDIKPNEPQPNPLKTGEETSIETFKNIGKDNLFTNQETAHDILRNFFNIIKSKQGTFQAPLVPYSDVIVKKMGDAAYLGAFFIEDFYHRGIEPTVDLITNKIKSVLGEYGKYITEDQAKTIFEKGKQYYDSNVADPFFSKMKQDATEKLPNRFTVEQARNILSQHENEFEWTTGLEEFLKENEGKKISRQDLVDVIQRGQVKVETSVAEELSPKRVAEIRNRISEIDFELDVETNIYIRQELKTEKSELMVEAAKKPQYSLKNYPHEKLELPGAENSKEVKLISIIPETQNQLNIEKQIEELSKLRNNAEADENYSEVTRLGNKIYNLNQYELDANAKVKYQTPHWDEPNVVAHYRSNDRITTDNIFISFSEEFQSDWMHDIRERGAKLTKEEETRFRELAMDEGDLSPQEENELRDYNRRQQGIEPNPFMQHSWKELVFKRFLRDAVVTKNENGNNKYEGIGWTTARQQQERYGKVLEGKDFEWKKNSDETYSFRMTTAEDNLGTTYHELQNISLERFAELTTKEAAQEVKDQEETIKQDKEANNILENDLSASFKTESSKYAYQGKFSLKEAVELRSGIGKYSDYDVAFVNYAKKIGKRFGAGYSEKEIITQNEDFVNTEHVPERYEKIHFLEITPSMRESLTKEGLPLYGLGGNEKLKSPDIGIRNKITTQQAFDEHRNSLVEALSNEFFNRKEKAGLESATNYYKSRLENPKLLDKAVHIKSSEGDLFAVPVDNVTRHFGNYAVEYSKQEADRLVKELGSKEGFNDIRAVESPFVSNKYLLFWGDPSITPEYLLSNSETILGKLFGYTDEAIKTQVENNNVFNSGLSPDTLIDSLKLTWADAKDFVDFSKELVGRFGNVIKPYLQDLWIQVKGFSNKVGNGIDAINNYLEKGQESPYYKARQEKESGVLKFGLKPKTPAEIAASEYKKSRKKIPYYEWYSLWRGVGLAQVSTDFGQVYDIMRGGQRVKNKFESVVLDYLRKANEIVEHGASAQEVADNIWIGNEQQKLYTNAELAAGDASINRPSLSPEQVQAYRHIRNALDIAIDIRRETKLYTMRQKGRRLNDQLNKATAGTPEHDAILGKLLDLDGAITKVKNHFEQLKKEGYISTQRRGPIAAFAEDPKFTSGSDEAKLYNHFDTVKEAQAWLSSMENKYKATNMKIYDVRKPNELRSASATLTPGQFEDLIDNAGVNPKASEIEKLRDEIYSRYPSFGYELKRDYVKGYDRNWQFALESIAHQTETYASSFYSRVAGEEAIKKLDSLDLQNKDYSLYLTSQKYIDHEISSPPEHGLGPHLEKYFPDIADKLPASLRNNLHAGGLRKGVYLFQLGYDINQLYLNALAQPITQTYNYFSRVEHNGITLKGIEPEQYFLKAGELTGRLGKEYLQKLTDSSYTDTKIPQELRDILSRLKSERVIEPEFNRSLLELESEKTTQAKLKGIQIKSKNFSKRFFSFKQQEHWAGVFMRMGEQTTRTHVATEAYLVGKEKFNLQGEELTDFIVRAVDATQSNPTRAEAPLAIRGSENTGETRKLLYQFSAFSHMWIENLALNARADLRARSIKNVSRQMAPLVLMGGLKGLPLAGFATVLYIALTDDDPKKHFDKWFGKDSNLESLALYGVTENAALSNRLTPSVPFLDQIRVGSNVKSTVSDTFAATNIPAIATGAQIARGFSDLLNDQKLRGLGELAPFKPVRTFATAVRYGGLPLGIYEGEGVRTRADVTIIPKSKLTRLDIIAASIGLQPTKLIENYENVRTQNLKNIHKSTISPLVRRTKKLVRKIL